METFGIVGLGIFLLLCVYCSFQESKVISPYKAHNVFGRLKAYLAMDFTLAGFMMWLASTFAPLFPSLDIANNMGIVGVIFGTALFGAGLMMYYITYINCPDELKKRCLIDMWIVALGVTMKICLFFLPFIWKIATYSGPSYEPPVVQQKKKVDRVWKEDANGNRTYYKVGRSGEYYQDEDGNWVRIKGV